MIFRRGLWKLCCIGELEVLGILKPQTGMMVSLILKLQTRIKVSLILSRDLDDVMLSLDLW